MDEDLRLQVAKLTEATEKQNELQSETNELLRALVDTLRATAQEIADWREAMD